MTPLGTKIYTLSMDPFEVCHGKVIAYNGSQYVCEVYSSKKGTYQETVNSLFLTPEEVMKAVEEIKNRFKNLPLKFFHRRGRATSGLVFA